MPADARSERTVFVARSAAGYGDLPVAVRAPELGEDVTTAAGQAIRNLFGLWGLDAERFGTSEWNPLGELIRPGARVVLKPNWVSHFNQSGRGLECLVTHSTVIEAVGKYVALARPSRVVLGDAPVQGCDFPRLRRACGIDEMAERLRARGLPVEVVDFRRTLLPGWTLGGDRKEQVRPLEEFVLVRLDESSLLEALAADSDKFRVTMYDPDFMRRTHGPGVHRYLVAREVLEADVVVNLPKLKTHKKAGITGALKNVVGINGNKEYLPHHRKGGGSGGGDCYEGNSWLKNRAEDLLDAANRRSGATQAILSRSAGLVTSVALALGENDNLEGSWFGNDTVWRTCLDLQRVLYYGSTTGRLMAEPQRMVITIADAIVGGQGEGPLANVPIASGFVTGALNTAAAEWCHARLMGFDPERVPLVREAFGAFTAALADFAPGEVVAVTADGRVAEADLGPVNGAVFAPPSGWRGHCERAAVEGAAV